MPVARLRRNDRFGIVIFTDSLCPAGTIFHAALTPPPPSFVRGFSGGGAVRSRSRWEHRALTEGLAVVTLEFEGGPLAGRRMLAPVGVRTLYWHGADGDGRPLVGTEPDPGRPQLSAYLHARTYDCPATWDCVVVVRWRAAAGGADEPARAAAPAVAAARAAPAVRPRMRRLV
jgi:hypothetical protein